MLRSLALLSVLLLAAGCGSESDTAARSDAEADGPASPSFQKEGALAFVRGQDTLSTLDVEIADTPARRERGLMERLALPEGSGMLFLFENNQLRSFHMANTPMALDILFANADSQIVHIAKHTTPYSTELIPSEAPAQFVVEVPAGYADRRGIVAGDRIRFERTGAAAGGAPFGPETDAQPDSLAGELFAPAPRAGQ